MRTPHPRNSPESAAWAARTEPCAPLAPVVEAHESSAERLATDSSSELIALARASVRESPRTGHQEVMGTRSLRSMLPRRLRASVRNPEEIHMGSPQYGRLVLDGRSISRPLRIEARSLLWSDDGTRLAAQELVSPRDPFSTRIVVFDTRERSTIASSSPRAGIANPLRFERDVLVYRHWHHMAGEQELRLTIDATTT
jgi:hypothetical protein